MERRAACAETTKLSAITALALFCTLLTAQEAQAARLRSGGRASENAASHWGYYVDHPERQVPASSPCNAFAKADLDRLIALGYRAYYLMAFIPGLGEGHIMVAVDFDSFTAVWDSLRPEPVTADQLVAQGYIMLGREINQVWYEVRA